MLSCLSLFLFLLFVRLTALKYVSYWDLITNIEENDDDFAHFFFSILFSVFDVVFEITSVFTDVVEKTFSFSI